MPRNPQMVYSVTPCKLVPPKSLPMIAVGLAVIFAGLIGGCATAPELPVATVRPSTVEVKLIAFNDFHGNLRTPNSRVPVADPSQSTGLRFQAAGGVEQFAALVRDLKQKNPMNAVVSAGDLVGATPLLSALFKDEPTIEAMNLIGIDFHAVGNHEFDNGVAQLKRLRAGGCETNVKTGLPDCQGRAPYAGAKFPFLTANVRVEDGTETLFPAYGVKEFDGVKVAFIGMTLRGTPQLVRPSSTVGLRFMDEVETVNQLLPQIKAQGINAIVVVMHQGGQQTGGINDCKDFSGAAKDIVERMSNDVSIVVTAHTHRYYICEIGGKLVTSAGSYGMLMTEIDLTLDRVSGRISQRSARNLVVKPDGAKAADLTELVQRYAALSEPLEKRVVGRLRTELSMVKAGTSESNLANMVVDAQLYATTSPDRGGAVIAFNNNDSLRDSLIPDADGGISYGAVFRAQPFQNDLIVMTLTGAQVKALLEQQWEGGEGPGRRMLGVSTGFRYTWDATKPVGQRVVVGSMALNGIPIRGDLQYRISVNSYLATGGSGMTVFRDGKDRQVSVSDIDAVVEYLGVKSPYQPPPLGTRIVRLN